MSLLHKRERKVKSEATYKTYDHSKGHPRCSCVRTANAHLETLKMCFKPFFIVVVPLHTRTVSSCLEMRESGLSYCQPPASFSLHAVVVCWRRSNCSNLTHCNEQHVLVAPAVATKDMYLYSYHCHPSWSSASSHHGWSALLQGKKKLVDYSSSLG